MVPSPLVRFFSKRSLFFKNSSTVTYPAKEIKALATAADVTGATKQLPFLLILPIKSKLAYVEVEFHPLAKTCLSA